MIKNAKRNYALVPKFLLKNVLKVLENCKTMYFGGAYFSNIVMVQFFNSTLKKYLSPEFFFLRYVFSERNFYRYSHAVKKPSTFTVFSYVQKSIAMPEFNSFENRISRSSGFCTRKLNFNIASARYNC